MEMRTEKRSRTLEGMKKKFSNPTRDSVSNVRHLNSIQYPYACQLLGVFRDDETTCERGGGRDTEHENIGPMFFWFSVCFVLKSSFKPVLNHFLLRSLGSLYTCYSTYHKQYSMAHIHAYVGA